MAYTSYLIRSIDDVNYIIVKFENIKNIKTT